MTFPSPSSGASSVPTSYGFEAAFLESRRAAESRPGDTRPELLATGSAPAYAPRKLRGVEFGALKADFLALNTKFLESPEGLRAREEWQDAMTAVLAFAKQHGLEAATKELSHVVEFRKKNAGPHVHGEIELYRPDCKYWLERLAQHLGNPRIDLSSRCQALLELEGLEQCPERYTSEFKKRSLWLEGRSGGLGNSVWSAFSAVALDELRTLLRSEPRLADHDFSTPHALDPFAAALRLPGFSQASEIADTFVLDVKIYPEVVARCAASLAQRVDMTSIAERLAEDCLLAISQKIDSGVNGTQLDLCDGDHWYLLVKALQELMPRFGDLHVHQVAALDDDGNPEGLTTDHRLLAIGIRHNMAQQGIAPAPEEQVLEERVADRQGRQRMVLFEGRWPYVAIDEGGKSGPLRRFMDRREIDALLRPTGQPRGLDARTRQALTAFAVSLSTAQLDPQATRELIASRPTAEGLETVIERQGLDDRELAAWLSKAAPSWDADLLDQALHLLLRGHGGASLAALFEAWNAEGFTDSWQRQLHDQAVRDRSLNTDLRVRGQHGDGDLGSDRRVPQRELLSRVTQQLGPIVRLAGARARLVRFKKTYPAGSDRSNVAGATWDELIAAVRWLRQGPARRLTVPLLQEVGGLTDALDSVLFSGSSRRLQDELALIRQLSIHGELSAEETAALLQVSDRSRHPVPSSLLSAALLAGKDSLIGSLSAWVTAMFREGLLDSASARRLLLPDGLEAEQAQSSVRGVHMQHALTRYFAGLDAACAAGVLRPHDLLTAAGAPMGEPSALLRVAAQRGGAEADAELQTWRTALPRRLAAQAASSLPSTRNSVSSA
ncbi:hypothetical protein [Mitsuaria sp. 7]|uniref:hypothetical protein n=1 Tax=Mitsuaria sp. 7 TaxID=1658665 RepID=UPI0007DD8937|nr:hypothetical protein [Mitsuaria sp. 7]ANH68683.1 hypothetical protein ABE85_15895 [Mitsuaria sp. 7]